MADVPQDVVKALLRTDFLLFLRKVVETIDPGVTYLHNWHIDAIVYEVMELTEGRNRRLIVNMPPRYLKSIMLSVALPAWILGRDFTARVICISYSGELAAKFSRDFRRVLEAPWYRALFPATRISKAKNTETEIETTRGGYRYATSIGGTLTGRGGDWLIIDDPLKQEEAESGSSRNRTNEWFFTTAANRLDNRQEGRIIVVMQRLHQGDLTGALLDAGGFRVLKLAAIAEGVEEIPVGKGRIHRRMPGEALHPGLETVEYLERIKRGMGSRAFQAQYQQEPVPAEGQMIKRSWFGTYTELPAIDQHSIMVLSIDTAAKATEIADYSVIMVLRYHRQSKQSFIIDIVRERFEFPDLRRKVLEVNAQHSPHYILIEDKGSGMSLIQELQRQGIHPISISPKIEKVLRVQAATPQLERGEVLMPANARWLEDFFSEICAYPQSKHDDQVDCLTQHLNWLPDAWGGQAGILGNMWSVSRRSNWTLIGVTTR